MPLARRKYAWFVTVSCRKVCAGTVTAETMDDAARAAAQCAKLVAVPKPAVYRMCDGATVPQAEWMCDGKRASLAVWASPEYFVEGSIDDGR